MRWMLCGILWGMGMMSVAGEGASKVILDAVAHSARPAEDRERDADRKPGDVLAYVGVAPGMTVADLSPMSGSSLAKTDRNPSQPLSDYSNHGNGSSARPLTRRASKPTPMKSISMSL